MQGLAGHVPFPSSPSGKLVDALVAEILGHVGSNEGYVWILQEIRIAYPDVANSIKAAVPLWFGTRMVPVDLSAAPSIQVSSIGPRVVLVRKFPFKDAQLVPVEEHGEMEMYNVLDELSRKGLITLIT